MNTVLFAMTVLIWGTTWIAITLQVGPVPVLVSVFYRFAAAGGVFLLGLALSGRLILPDRRHRPWILAQALCLFSLNFICFYAAAAYIPSGLLSVVFSLATLFNAFNARLFFGDRITGRVMLASALGVLGLVLLFGPDLSLDASGQALHGIALAALGTLFFSLGNMISRRNSAAGLGTIAANAWGMACGAAILLAAILASGTPMIAPPDAAYLGAMLYLAVFGSIIAFTTYLMLVARVGSSRAAYATVLFPIVALAISTVFEGYEWTWVSGAGVLLALLGNAVMFVRLPKGCVRGPAESLAK
ncbi:DMT family transporter [Tropicimonas sp. TH_r6]|uniref:DMT family transporter n=1 Tax=Tropicimonas sp. TH_r6 TaxID=3082085 RepID=UPI002953A0B1|nr:DMT family transporter [Tropicimonas sp. TH_r6]MDV7143779.1 DMT family transporter [Tropicimonas sp. TH_r6]